jgi:hypothetical protein
MTGPRTSAAVAVSAALVLAGCRGGTAADSSEATPSSTEARTSTSRTSAPSTSTSASSTTKPPKKTIRSVDLRNTKWNHLRGNSSGPVTFKNGKASVASTDLGPVTYELRPSDGDLPRYVDADGDGDLDAVLRVESVEGNAWMAEGFVWLWDSKRQQAVQQHKPLYTDLRCDDHVTDAVEFDGSGRATISYRQQQAGAPCAADPTIPRTRVISMKGTSAPYQLKPWPSSLDSCTPSAGSGDVFYPEQLGPKFQGFRAAPSDDAPIIARKGDMQMWNAADHGPLPKVGGWMLVWYIPKAQKLSADKDEFPCGWMRRTG